MAVPLTIPSSIRFSSPAAEQLSKLADLLWGATSRTNKQFGTNYTFRVPLFILTKAMDFESKVSAYSLLMDLSKTDLDLKSCAADISSLIECENPTQTWIGPLSAKHKGVMLQVDSHRARRIAEVVESLVSPKKAVPILCDLVDVALLVALCAKDVTFCANEKNLSVSDLWIPSVPQKDAIRFIFQSLALEEELALLLLSTKTSDPEHLLIDRIAPLFSLLPRLRSSKRLAGHITDYDRLAQQGEFERRQWLFRPKSSIWQGRDVLQLGLEPLKSHSIVPACLEYSRKHKSFLSVITPISRSKFLAVDGTLRKFLIHYSEHRLMYSIGLLLFMVSLGLFIASLFPLGIAALVISLIAVGIGRAGNKLFRAVRNKLDLSPPS